jgi:hypothetical protein
MYCNRPEQRKASKPGRGRLLRRQWGQLLRSACRIAVKLVLHVMSQHLVD